MNHISPAAARSGLEASGEATRKLVFAGVFAALTYVVFTFLSIPIPTIGGSKVTVHLGNAFVALGALLILIMIIGGIRNSRRRRKMEQSS